jgi:hypothetical protein
LLKNMSKKKMFKENEKWQKEIKKMKEKEDYYF